MLKRAVLVLGPLLWIGSVGVATAADSTACDRNCLEGIVTQYLNALVKRDPSAAPLATSVRFTENSTELKIGEGLWKTASKLRTYRQDILDARAGVAGTHVVIEESGAPVMLAARLKVVDRKITEVETMTIRNAKEGAIFTVDALKSASKAMTVRPPRAQLPTREEAIRIADFYPRGLQAGSFVIVNAPFATNAYRFENGHLMAGPGCTFREQCENIKTQPSPTRPDLTSRMVAVDEEQGVVWYRLAWGRPENRQMVVWEAFKVYDGKIQAVEAFMKLMPAGVGSGWEPLPTAAATAELEEKNRKLVIDMWQGVIIQLDEAAVMKYIAPGYIQHNPNVAPGRDGILAAVRRARAGGPHSVKRLIHSFAQGDLVVLVWDRDLPDPKNPGKIYTNNAFDMFRVKDGMIVEHWDDAHKNP